MSEWEWEWNAGEEHHDYVLAQTIKLNIQARKGKRREKNRTTSLAVDVASYFKVEMDQ